MGLRGRRPQADSVVVNPHKWLLTPIDCSSLYTRRPEVLREAFSIAPEYLRTGEEDVTNLIDYGPVLGRRFRSLKLWAVIRCYGREGLQAVIREHVRLAKLFASWVEATPGWEVVAPVPFSLVCFRREGSDEENEAIIERVNATGEAYLSNTTLDDRFVLRLAIGHDRTTEDDVRLAWSLLQDAAPSSIAYAGQRQRRRRRSAISAGRPRPGRPLGRARPGPPRR